MNTYPISGIQGSEFDSLKAIFGSDILGSKEFRGETFIFVNAQAVPQILKHLKEDPILHYDYFVECVGVDYSEWKHPRDLDKRFEVVYNLYSTKNHTRVFIKCAVDENETIPTAKHIFLGAEYPEREIQDLYGIIFTGNEPLPNQRFLLPDDWVGYPLRKDFPLGGEDVVFHAGTEGPAVEDLQVPHAGESFEGKTGSNEISGR